MAKDSFILYTEQKAVLDKLTDEQAGKLIKAIYQYEETGIMPELDTVLDLVITPFKTALDKNADKWEEIKQKRSEAGKIGAEKKKQKEANQANADFAKQNKQDEANQAVYVNDNVNVSVNEDIKEKNKKKKFQKPKVEEIQKYCYERKNNVNAQQFYDYYESNGWKVGKNAMKDWQATIRTWEQRNKSSTKKSAVEEWLNSG